MDATETMTTAALANGRVLARLEVRQEHLIAAVTGLTETVGILSEQIGELVELTDAAAPEPGRESLQDVLARIAGQMAENTAAVRELATAIDRLDRRP
jgi:hypothetical protein